MRIAHNSTQLDDEVYGSGNFRIRFVIKCVFHRFQRDYHSIRLSNRFSRESFANLCKFAFPMYNHLSFCLPFQLSSVSQWRLPMHDYIKTRLTLRWSLNWSMGFHCKVKSLFSMMILGLGEWRKRWVFFLGHDKKSWISLSTSAQ